MHPWGGGGGGADEGARSVGGVGSARRRARANPQDIARAAQDAGGECWAGTEGRGRARGAGGKGGRS